MRACYSLGMTDGDSDDIENERGSEDQFMIVSSKQPCGCGVMVGDCEDDGVSSLVRAAECRRGWSL